MHKPTNHRKCILLFLPPLDRNKQAKLLQVQWGCLPKCRAYSSIWINKREVPAEKAENASNWIAYSTTQTNCTPVAFFPRNDHRSLIIIHLTSISRAWVLKWTHTHTPVLFWICMFVFFLYHSIHVGLHLWRGFWMTLCVRVFSTTNPQRQHLTVKTLSVKPDIPLQSCSSFHEFMGILFYFLNVCLGMTVVFWLFNG